jgi:hypothetical protein
MSLLIKTTEDQSFWIEVQGSRFLVCPVTNTEDTAIAKKYTEWKKGFPVPDQAKIRREKFIKTVLDWEDVRDVNGNEVPFSEEMRKNFVEYNPDFAWLIIRKAEQHEVEEREAEDLNLGE